MAVLGMVGDGNAIDCDIGTDNSYSHGSYTADS